MGSIILLPLFLIAAAFCFTIPGLVILERSKVKLSNLELFTLGTILGLVAFTLFGYLLLIFQVPLLVFLLVAIANLLAFRKFKLNLQFDPPKRQLVIFWVILVIGILGQLAIISPSGTFSNGDLVFWSAHGHDGSWHLALMEEIKKGWPLQNPVFAGEKLVNYHFFSDIAPAFFSKYFGLSSLDLYFRFFPLIYSLLLGLSAYLLGRKIGRSDQAGLWSVFFTYFAGSFGFIVTWLKNGTIGGESIFWATQIQSSIGNPPQIVSNIMVMAFLYLYGLYLSSRNWLFFLSCLLIAGTLVEFKVYAGVVLLLALGLVGLWQLIKERRFDTLLLFTFATLMSAILYFPNSAGANSFLIFEPWWFIRTMIVSDSRLNWLDLEHKRQTYIAEGNIKRVIQIELTGLLIFFFGNLGMRFLGLWSFGKMALKSNYLNQLIILIPIFSLVLPLLFLQKGVASNTSQFLQYFLLLFGIFAGITVADLLSKIKTTPVKVLIIVLLVVLSIPTQAGLLYDFYSRPPTAKISSTELAALKYLGQHSSSDAIILTPPYNQYLDLKASTPNIWDWYDTSYVSAFSSSRVYFADYEQVDIMGYDYKNRQNFEQTVFSATDSAQIIQAVKKQNITYFYFPKELKPNFPIDQNFSKAFENSAAEIWRVNP